MANCVYAQSFFEPSTGQAALQLIILIQRQTHTSVQWNGRTMAVITDNERTPAVVGIPLSLAWIIHEATRFYRAPHDYAERRLTITNKRKVNPAPLDMIRIATENKRLKVVKSSRAERHLD